MTLHDLPKSAGGLDAYEFYIEFALQWECHECKASLDSFADMTKKEESEVPYGSWRDRQAKRARDLGWYVPPLTEDGSLLSVCLCPSCTKKLGYVVAPKNA